MTAYADLLGPRRTAADKRHATTSTSQSVPLKGREAEMHRNAAGGYAFNAGDETTLRRFLILGTTQGTYYANAETLSQDALALIDRMIAADPINFVNIVVDVSVSGGPLKQSPCIFAMARACSTVTGDHARDTNQRDPVTMGRAYALEKAPAVLRTFQHVFEFLDYLSRQRGKGGNGLKRMLSSLVLNIPVRDLEYQALKYRQRVGFTPRDLLRLAHPETAEADRDHLMGWIVKPDSAQGREAVKNSTRLAAFEELQSGVTADRAAQLISQERLTHEFVPNELLNDKTVWEALLPNLPLTALVRNLRKMTQVGLLVDSNRTAIAILRTKLCNPESLRKARLHPLRIMMADRAYRSGTSKYGHGATFTPSAAVLSVLEEALELSWSAVEPLNRRVLVAIDDSGSMSTPSGAEGLDCFEAGIALAQWYRRAENECQIVSFTDSGSTRAHAFSQRASWNEMVRSIQRSYRGTDLAEPVNWAWRNKADYEVIIQITDNETWSGSNHLTEALGRYRKQVGHSVAYINAAASATQSTMADPKDPHSLNVVGFDPTVPEAIAAHVKEVFR